MLVIPTLPPVDHPVGADDLAKWLGVERDQLGEFFIGTGELLELWKISKQTFYDLGRRHSDFPEPAFTLKGGAVWMVADVAKYARAHEREVPGDTRSDQGKPDADTPS